MLFDLVMVVVNQKIVQDNPVIVVHHLYILMGGLLHWLYAPVAWGYCWQANSFSTHQHTHTHTERERERESRERIRIRIRMVQACQRPERERERESREQSCV